MAIAATTDSGAVPLAEYRRVCAERDAAQAKLSALAALLQNPELTWQQRGRRAAIVLALEAQRPRHNPTGAFSVDTGDLAKRAGLIPPTPDGDDGAWRNAHRAGRKHATQALKELADVGLLAEHRVEKNRAPRGEVLSSSIVVAIDKPHVELIRGAGRIPGTRTLQQPRGNSRPICPDCGPDAPVIERKTVRCVCGRCGQALGEPVTTERELPPEPDQEGGEGEASATFRSLALLSTEEHREEPSRFQRLESGEPPTLFPMTGGGP